MDNKEELIDAVVKAEWEMFQQVQGVGGRAPCQDDFTTFKIMRTGQGLAWSEAALESYLDDLKQAEQAGRNLLSEKYARMMKSTAPADYARIEHLLPPIDPEVFQMIEEIAEIMLEWEESLVQRYSRFMSQGRPIRSCEDTPYATSVETYLRGELLTYSRGTIQLYFDNILKQKREDVNAAEITHSYIAGQYGYGSIGEADDKLKRDAGNQSG